MKNSLYTLNFDSNGNSIKRNSNCNFGGSTISFQITSPTKISTENVHVIGIKVSIIVFVPKQNNGKNEFYDTKVFKKVFDSNNLIQFDVKVQPEYSYLISGNFYTKFGNMKTGKNFSLSGEIERSIKKVGCYMKNDFFFKNLTGQNRYYEYTDSLIECSNLCHFRSDCILGWSYHIVTKKCYFLSKANLTKINPAIFITPEEKSAGWITGLKSCSVPSRVLYTNSNLIENIFI